MMDGGLSEWSRQAACTVQAVWQNVIRRVFLTEMNEGHGIVTSERHFTRCTASPAKITNMVVKMVVSYGSIVPSVVSHF